MNVLIALLGKGQDLDSTQMGMRAAVAFFAALVLIRISGRRSFGHRSPFDYVVAVLLGATLSRFIVGASPVIPTLTASLVMVMVLVHRTLGWACVRSRHLESWVVGIEREVFSDGHFNDEQMSAALITKADIFESARQELGALDLDKVQAAILERNGEVSLIRKSENKRPA